MSSEIDKKIDELLAACNNFSKDIESKFSKEKNDNSQNSKNALEEKNYNINEEMIDLKRRMVKLEGRMDNLENRMDNLENTVNDMGTKMDSRFDNLEKRVRSIKGIVGENMSDIADINRRLGKAN